MPKGSMTSISMAGILVAGVLFSCSSPLDRAREAERGGNPARAREAWISALGKALPSRTLPDRNQARILKASDWQAQQHEYLRWVKGGKSRPVRDLAEIMQGIGRNMHLPNENLLSLDSAHELSEVRLEAAWNELFFPAGVAASSGQKELVAYAREHSLTIVRFVTRNTILYHCAIIDTLQRRRTEFTVYAQDSTSLLLQPGDYLLQCRAEVSWENGQIWRSATSLIPLTIGSGPALQRGILKTRVNREG